MFLITTCRSGLLTAMVSVTIAPKDGAPTVFLLTTCRSGLLTAMVSLSVRGDHLQLIEPGVDAVLCKQLGMGAGLDNPSVIHGNYPVGMFNC